MAVGAGVSCIVLDVAGLAADLAFIAVIEREGVLGQASRQPGSRRVAANTILAKKSSMDGRFLVAADTVARCAGKN